MAKDNMLLGFARGSVGDLTFRRVRGRQVISPRVRNPRNPQSDAQTIARLAFSSAGKLARQLEMVVSNSYQTLPYGQQSVNRFVSDASKAIGDYTRKAYGGYDSEHFYGYAPVVPYSSRLGVCVPVRVAEGDLSAGYLAVISEGQPLVNFGLAVSLPVGVTGITPANYERLFGVPLDCQLTFIAGRAEELPEYDTPSVVSGVRYRIGRLNWLPGLADDAELFNINGSSATINMAMVDPARSSLTGWSINLPASRFSVTLEGEQFGEGDDGACCAAVIVSKYEGGRWRRSTSDLVTPLTIQTAVMASQSYGWNYLDDIIDLSRKGAAAPAENAYLNKEPI